MKDGLILRNLTESEEEQARISARRAFYLADAAHLAAERLSPPFSVGESAYAPPEGLSHREQALYAELLFRELHIGEEHLLPYHKGSTRIAYLRHGYADAAYALFAELLDGATVSYTETNRDAAEEVFSEIADFCILPFSDREGNLVRTARAIAEERGLLLASKVSVGTGEAGALTYALYGRALLPPQDKALALSLRVPGTCAAVLSRLSAAIEQVGASVGTLESDTARSLVRVTLTIPRQSLALLCFVLLTVLPGADIVGLSPADES